MERKKALQWGVLSAIFALSFVLYYICCIKTLTFYNSDATYYMTAGVDIISGNIFLDKWYGAGNSLYFLALLYGVLGTLFGYSFELLCIVSALLWACLVALVAWIILELYIEKPRACTARLCSAFILCFSSCFFLQGAKTFAGSHFDIIIIGIFYLWVVSREIELCKNCTPQLILASILLLLALWSDDLTQVFIVLPAFAGLIFNLIFVPAQKVKQKYIIKHLTLCAALFVTISIDVRRKYI